MKRRESLFIADERCLKRSERKVWFLSIHPDGICWSRMDEGVIVQVTKDQLVPLFVSAAMAQDPSLLRNFENQLKNLETCVGFHNGLLCLIADKSLENGVRLQAVLYLKNGIDRYWRKTAPNAIKDEEKWEIRSNLLQLYVEPVFPIALQLAVIVGKVSRFDVPKEWPELFPMLQAGIQNTEPMVQHRSLLVLYHVNKILASKRLGHDRRVFHELTEQLLPFLLPIWRTHHTHLITTVCILN